MKKQWFLLVALCFALCLSLAGCVDHEPAGEKGENAVADEPVVSQPQTPETEEKTDESVEEQPTDDGSEPSQSEPENEEPSSKEEPVAEEPPADDEEESPEEPVADTPATEPSAPQLEITLPDDVW